MLRTKSISSSPLVLLIALISMTLFAQATTRLAVFPPLMDGGRDNRPQDRTHQQIAADFQAALESKLNSQYDTLLVSRSQLACIAFENKLRVLNKPELKNFSILPCEFTIVSLYNSKKRNISIFPISIKTGKIPSPIVVSIKNSQSILDSADKACQQLAEHLKLKNTQTGALVSEPSKIEASVSITPSAHSTLTSKSSEETKWLTETLSMTLQEAIDQGAPLKLIDRNHLSSVMQEMKIAGLDHQNAHLTPAHIQNIDVILQPRVLRKGKQAIHMITAIDPQSSAILNSALFTPEEVKAQALDTFITQALNEKSEVLKASLNNKELITNEINLCVKIASNLQGLRMSSEAADAFRMELTQAATGLSSQVPEKTLDTLSVLLSKIVDPNGSEDFNRIFEQNFHLAVSELENIYNAKSTQVQTRYWRQLGNFQKALDCITDQNASDYRATLYQTEAHILYHLKRYQECIDLVLARKRFSQFAMLLVADSHRELGEFRKEQRLLYRNSKNLGNNIARHIRLMDLTNQYMSPSHSIYFWTFKAHSWTKLQPEVLLKLAECFIADGQNDMALDVYKALAQRDDKHAATAKAELKKAGITDLNFPPIKAADFLKLDPETAIEIVSDDTIPLKDIKETAQIMADFWGLNVHLYHGVINFELSPSYNKLKSTMQADEFTTHLLHFPKPKSQSVIYRYILSKHRLISSTKNYTADIFSSPEFTFELCSAYYIYNYRRQYGEKRPKPEVIAIMLGGITPLERAIKLRKEYITLKIPPYIFSNNPNLTFLNHKLTLSNEIAELLSRVTSEDVREIQARMNELADSPKNKKDLPENQKNFIQQATSNYNSQPPIIITPKKNP